MHRCFLRPDILFLYRVVLFVTCQVNNLQNFTFTLYILHLALLAKQKFKQQKKKKSTSVQTLEEY